MFLGSIVQFWGILQSWCAFSHLEIKTVTDLLSALHCALFTCVLKFKRQLCHLYVCPSEALKGNKINGDEGLHDCYNKGQCCGCEKNVIRLVEDGGRSVWRRPVMVLCHNDRCCDEGVERRQRVFAFFLTLGFNVKSVYSDTRLDQLCIISQRNNVSR